MDAPRSRRSRRGRWPPSGSMRSSSSNTTVSAKLASFAIGSPTFPCGSRMPSCEGEGCQCGCSGWRRGRRVRRRWPSAQATPRFCAVVLSSGHGPRERRWGSCSSSHPGHCPPSSPPARRLRGHCDASTIGIVGGLATAMPRFGTCRITMRRVAPHGSTSTSRTRTRRRGLRAMSMTYARSYSPLQSCSTKSTFFKPCSASLEDMGTACSGASWRA